VAWVVVFYVGIREYSKALRLDLAAAIDDLLAVG